MPSRPKTDNGPGGWKIEARSYSVQLAELARSLNATLLESASTEQPLVETVSRDLLEGCERALRWVDTDVVPPPTPPSLAELSAAAGVLRNACWLLNREPALDRPSLESRKDIAQRLIAQGIEHAEAALATL